MMRIIILTGWRRWLGLAGAAVSASLIFLVYFGLDHVLGFTADVFNMAYPDLRLRYLVGVVIFCER